jgi:Domain of unknown function (DUF4032)/Lipopolysaccharide kinase (Kdo/WaaP) family
LKTDYSFDLTLQAGHPDFSDLPWQLPISMWEGSCLRLEDVNHGVSRHPVIFVNYDGILYVLKELPPGIASKEYNSLITIASLRLPVVSPVGFANTTTDVGPSSILITRYLENSIPYRSLFMTDSLSRYKDYLLDAIAGLLVQLHMAGIFWGDCSLSNTLFRRDAGALQAYLVDAETVEYHPDHFSPALRHQDLEIMELNINGELLDLEVTEQLSVSLPPYDTGAYIQIRYQRIWEEITREQIINPDEHYRIQERVRALNALGYSVKHIALVNTDNGNQLRIRPAVTDRNFHRNQLFSLTGLTAEEMQARKMMNEILEIKATLSQTNNRSTPISVAAHHWLENYYKPTIAQLHTHLGKTTLDPAELYCQVLEHKWFLSERAHHDVGHQIATEDYIKRFTEVESN